MQVVKPIEVIELEQKHNFKIINLNGVVPSRIIDSYYKTDANNVIIELVIANVAIKSLFEIRKFPNLRRLSLNGCSLKGIASTIFSFTNLEHLDLSNNEIEDISILKHISWLKYVDISDNAVFDLSPLYNNLRYTLDFTLKATGNPLIYPPVDIILSPNSSIVRWFDKTWEGARQKIAKCLADESTYLELGNCGLTDLSYFPELFRCTHLKTLILSNEWPEFKNGDWSRISSENSGIANNIFYVDKGIRRLRELNTFICGGDWNFKKEPRWNRWRIGNFQTFDSFSNLECLNISNNKILRIKSLGKLTNLKKLHLNNNLIVAVEHTLTFESLEELYLSNNFLKDISFLCYFPNLKTVDLHANRIRSLRSIRPLLPKLDISDTKWKFNVINLAKNPQIQPSQLFISSGSQNLLAYFEQEDAEGNIDLAPYVNKDVKVILVGNSNVGKSTLAEWLKNKKFTTLQRTTHWLDVCSYNIQHARREVKIQLFDFGGQEYYHDTHHLFFTNQTVYLLLWDKESENFDEKLIEQTQVDGTVKKLLIQNFPLHYWLDSIKYYSEFREISDEEARINSLVEAKGRQLLRIKDIYVKKTEGSKSDVTEYLEKEQHNVIVLQNKVDNRREAVFINEKQLTDSYPKIYDFFRLSIHNRKGLAHAESLLLDVITTLPITGRQYLGTWGIIKDQIERDQELYKKDITLRAFKQFCNKIIRNIPEVKNASAKQITKIQFNNTDTINFANYLNNIGILLFFPKNINLKDRVFLNQKDLLFKIHNVLSGLGQLNGEFTNTHVVEKLKFTNFNLECRTIIELMISFKIIIQHPVNSKIYIAPLYLPKEPSKSVKLFLSAFTLPSYRFLFNGFIHKSLILEFFSIYRKNVLKDSDDENFFYYWREGIILKDEDTGQILMVKFVNGQPNGNSAHIDIFCLKSPSNHKFLENVVAQLELLSRGRDVIKAVSADGLDFVPLSVIHENEKRSLWYFQFNNKNYKLHDFKSFLQEHIVMKKIFISYSKDDLALVDKFLEHLSTLKQDGKISSWFCTELVAGSEWSSEIKTHFDESDIICFMVSPSFIKTKYIMEHEVKWAFERRGNDMSFKIVPIVLDFCRWSTIENNLADYTALPFTAKPILDFRNQNMAWYITVECIRIMIELDVEATGDTFYVDKLPKDVKEIYKRIVDGQVDA